MALSWQGYDLVVGGGMGRAHRNKETFPRLADPLGYVDKDDILHAVKAIVATQRDYGRRDDRKQVPISLLERSPCLRLFLVATAHVGIV